MGRGQQHFAKFAGLLFYAMRLKCRNTFAIYCFSNNLFSQYSYGVCECVCARVCAGLCMCAYPQADFRDKNIRKWSENSRQQQQPQQQVPCTKQTNREKKRNAKRPQGPTIEKKKGKQKGKKIQILANKCECLFGAHLCTHTHTHTHAA